MSNKHLRFLVIMLAILAVSSIILAACTRPGATPNVTTAGTPPGNGTTQGGTGGCATASSGTPSVHMGSNNFIQSCATLSKGQKISFIDDVQVVHILDYGSWNGSTPQPASAPKAPPLNNLQFSGNDTHDLGPFTTAGTYHIYCTVHPGMNLVVTVK